MSAWEWLTLAGLCLAGATSPGPSLAVVVNAARSGSRITGMAAAWAHASGVGLYAAITVLGLSALVAQRAWLYLAIQIAGAAYLLWLAAGLWASKGAPSDSQQTSGKSPGQAARDGFAIAFLNPKLAVFMLALFSQFLQQDATILTNVGLIATATLIDGLWYTVVTLLLTTSTVIDRLQQNAARIDRLFGCLLAALALVVLANAAASVFS